MTNTKRSNDDEAPRTRVPADINTPDKIIFGLTVRQVGIVAAAFLAAWLVFRAVGTRLPPLAWLGAGIVYAGLVLAVVLGRRDGLSMDAWLAAALRSRRTPRLQAPPGVTSVGGAGLARTTTAVGVPAVLRLPADAITPEGLVRHGEQAAAVVATGTVHLGLRTGGEQAGLIEGMGRWLNSLTAPAQIVVSTQRVDLEPAAAAVEGQAALLPDPALADAALDYAAFLRQLAATRDPLRRSVLVVVRADPRERGGAARRATETATALSALGLPVRVLDGPGYTAALTAAVDPYRPPVAGARATPDQVITTDRTAWD